MLHNSADHFVACPEILEKTHECLIAYVEVLFTPDDHFGFEERMILVDSSDLVDR